MPYVAREMPDSSGNTGTGKYWVVDAKTGEPASGTVHDSKISAIDEAGNMNRAQKTSGDVVDENGMPIKRPSYFKK